MNPDRVLVFPTVILQCVSGVSRLRNICNRIDSRINLCNNGANEELVQYSHRAAE